MGKLLVIFQDNWADEMYVAGFTIATQEEWDKFVEHVNQRKYPFEVYIGTNEELVYRNSKRVLECYTTKFITEDEVSVIEQCFNQSYLGEVGYFDRYKDYLEDEDLND